MRRIHYIVALIIVLALSMGVAYVMSRTSLSFQVTDYNGQPAPLREISPETGPVADATGWIFLGLGVVGGGAVAFTIWAIVQQMRRIRRGR